MNPEEFLSFGSLRAGASLQWINLMAELVYKALDFQANEVFLLCKHTIFEIGPLQGQQREYHAILHDSNFASTLLRTLRHLFESVKANWQQTECLRLIVVVLNKIGATVVDQLILSSVMDLMMEIRKALVGWMDILSSMIEESDQKVQLQKYLCRTAMVCQSTFDLGPDHSKRILELPGNVHIYLRASLLLSHHFPSRCLDAYESNLLACNAQLCHSLEPHISHSLSRHSKQIHEAVRTLWTAYTPGNEWIQCDGSRWITSMTAHVPPQKSQQVHVNLLSGELLVDGVPLGLLPAEYSKNVDFIDLFGNVMLPDSSDYAY